MTTEEIKEAAKVMEAYTNGKKIQIQNYDKTWNDCPSPIFNWGAFKYRVKPEIKYRPFETQEECLEEMHKHPDFGWVKSKYNQEVTLIGRIFTLNKKLFLTWSINEGYNISSSDVFSNYTFTDDTPFGIKKE